MDLIPWELFISEKVILITSIIIGAAGYQWAQYLGKNWSAGKRLQEGGLREGVEVLYDGERCKVKRISFFKTEFYSLDKPGYISFPIKNDRLEIAKLWLPSGGEFFHPENHPGRRASDKENR